jgi:hypothetical protein
MNNTLQIAYVEYDLTHGVLKNTPIRVLVSLYVLVWLCNTPLIVKIYVINPKAFSGYLEKGNVTSLHPFGHEQYLSNSVGKK